MTPLGCSGDLCDGLFRSGKTAVVYTRVSTQAQADSAVSTKTQIEVCTKWCEQNGVEIIAIYKDEGVSGTTTNRDAFADALGRIIAAKPHYLVVYDSSRLTRGGSEELDYLKQVLSLTRCEVIYAGYGGMSGNSASAVYMDEFKASSDKLFITEQKKRTQDSISRRIAEGKHVSRSPGFVFEDDIPLMPAGRVQTENRPRIKVRDGKTVSTVTEATVVRSFEQFLYLVDRGASVEVIAALWGVSRYALYDALRGITYCKREKIELPDRSAIYREHLKAAKEKGIFDEVLLGHARDEVRIRKVAERSKSRKSKTDSMVGTLDGGNTTKSAFSRAKTDVEKGVYE